MKIYVYSGTHWDREWYKSFQGFRKMLVEMTDDLVGGIEKTEGYGVFHMDGQTIVLEDYLRIRPEKRDELTRLIREGRIVIGPWYDMPDEFLISGESMIKNLRIGMALARSFGVEPSCNAYVCDIFGHSSQTPQIFAGMNLHNTVLGRGTNEHKDPGQFRWQALDGTEVLAYRLRDFSGYGDFGCIINANPSTLSDEELDRAIKAYVDDEIERCEGIPVLCLFDATDHQGLRRDTPRYLESLRRVYPDAEVYHASIDEMSKEQSKYADMMQVRKGELCDTTKRVAVPYNHVITHTLSSRYPLKKYNDQNQTRMEKWVAPLYALGLTSAAPGFLREADNYLIKNHPHDSICGCSIDQVHRDMMCRFDQTRLISDEIINPFLTSLNGDMPYLTSVREEEGGSKVIRIFNPLPYGGKRAVTAILSFDGLPTYAEPFGYERIPSFRLVDINGMEVPYGYVRPLPGNRYELALETELTPCSVTELRVCPSPVPTRYPNKLLRTLRTAEGENITIAINHDGTVDLTDKKTGQVYRNLLTMVDDGEIGDGWYHCNPNIDKIVSPTQADVQVIENSTVRVTFRILQHMELPIGVDRSCGILRSDKTVSYIIRHDVTLSKGDRGITVTTSIDNNACDHRLRLRLPEVVAGDTYEAAQSFGYVTRTCGDDPSTALWKEYRGAERNMANICAKRNGDRGLAFLSAYGLHECGVWQNGDMDVTLMRCFSRTIHTAGEPDGQLQQNLEYCYRIQLYTADDDFASLQREQDFLSTGTRSVTVNALVAREYRPLLKVDGKGVVYSTAAPLADGSAELRIFNDSDQATVATVLLPCGVKMAALTEIDGRPICDLSLAQGSVSFELPAFRFATVRFS